MIVVYIEVGLGFESLFVVVCIDEDVFSVLLWKVEVEVFNVMVICVLWCLFVFGWQYGQICGYQVYYVCMEGVEVCGLLCIKDVMLVDVQEMVIINLQFEIVYFIMVVVYIMKGDGVCSKFKVVVIKGVVLGCLILLVQQIFEGSFLVCWEFLVGIVEDQVLGYCLQFGCEDFMFLVILEFLFFEDCYMVLGVYKGVMYVFWLVVWSCGGLGEEVVEVLSILEDMFCGYLQILEVVGNVLVGIVFFCWLLFVFVECNGVIVKYMVVVWEVGVLGFV